MLKMSLQVTTFYSDVNKLPSKILVHKGNFVNFAPAKSILGKYPRKHPLLTDNGTQNIYLR